MKGNLLEAYCALAKAYCFLDIARTEHDERKIDELIEKSKSYTKRDIQVRR